MLRPKLQRVYNNKDLIVQMNDWRSYDVIDDSENEENSDDENNNNKKKWITNRKFLIKGYGITEEGHSISININGFTPYFFMKIPNEWG